MTSNMNTIGSTVAEAIDRLPDVTAEVKKQAQKISGSASHVISPGFSPWFLPEGVIEGIKGIRGMEVPKGTNIHCKFFGEGLLNGIDPRIPNNIGVIKENGIKLTKLLGKHLGIELPERALFNSPGVITRIDGEGVTDGSYHSFNLLSEATLSDVFQSYNCDPNFFLYNSFYKALVAHLVNSASHIEKGLTMPISVMQKSIKDNIGKQQYRGGISVNSPTGIITYGTSGSSLDEEVIEAIAIEILGVTIKDYIEGCGIKRCDALAGLGDELFSRLVSGTAPEFAVIKFLEVIKGCRIQGTMATLN